MKLSPFGSKYENASLGQFGAKPPSNEYRFLFSVFFLLSKFSRFVTMGPQQKEIYLFHYFGHTHRLLIKEY